MRVLAVDGSNIHARAVHAAAKTKMHSGTVDTGALHVFARMLSRYVRQERPTHIVVCWDRGESVYRRGVFEGYKASRTPKEDDPSDHTTPRALVQRFLELSGIQQWEHEGIEADDLIAALWRRREYQSEFVILSGDKDFLQLLDQEGVWQIRPGVNPEIWGRFTVRGEFNVEPEHMPFFMALCGDTSDEVPGVAGIGPKGAAKVLAESQWAWERVLEHPKVEAHREDAELSLRLVGLREERLEVPGFDLSPFDPDSDSATLERFLANYGMESVLESLRAGKLW